MATTSKGTPYVEAADLVSGYPTVSLNLAEHIDDNVAYNAATINAQTGTTYTFVLADATEGKLVTASNASSQTYTVPPESSVAWPAGSILRILNQGAGVVTVAAGSGVTINGTPLTLAQYKGAAIQKTGTNTWTFIPFSGGVGSAVISSPAATGSYSSGGTTYNYYTFTASGTVTVDTAGFADVLVVAGGGGGGGGGAGGGGGGGYLEQSVYLNATSYTVTVGAGGTGSAAGGTRGTNGNSTKMGALFSLGGGGGGAYTPTIQGLDGGSGGGGAANAGAGGSGLQNFNGGAAGTNAGGGGGGATANGSNAPAGTTGGNGGAGQSSSLTGSAETRGGGGGGGSVGGTAGTGVDGGTNGTNNSTKATNAPANRGGGGGGGGNTDAGGGNGGSGIVIIRVAV